MKIAINRDFGGFNLSDEAFEALLDRKGIAWEKSNSKYGLTNYYQKGHAGSDDHYISQYDYYEDRADPDLIAVIEEFGKRANGHCATLKIVNIPKDVEWVIEEYDGREWVAEKHRTWC